MGKCFEAYVCGPCRARRWDISNYRWCCVQSQFSETDLEAKHKWIYAVVPLSVGPVVIFFKYTLYTTYPIFEYIPPPGKQLWIYAVMLMSVGPVGPGGGIYSSTEDVLCRVNFRKMIWRPNNCGYMQFCFCLWWDIFNYRLCYVQSLFSDGSSWPCYMLTKWELDQWHIDQVRSWTTGNLTKNFLTTSMRHLPIGDIYP